MFCSRLERSEEMQQQVSRFSFLFHSRSHVKFRSTAVQTRQPLLCIVFFTLFTDFFYYQLTYQKSSNVKVNRYQAAYIRSNCNFIGNCKMVTIIRIMLVGDLVFLHVFFALPADIYIRWLIPWSLILLCTCVFI